MVVYPSYYPFTITETNTVYSNVTNSCCPYCRCEKKQEETKKQRIARIAKEKMLASWKIYNQKTETINEILKECKPCYNIYYYRR